MGGDVVQDGPILNLRVSTEFNKRIEEARNKYCPSIERSKFIRAAITHYLNDLEGVAIDETEVSDTLDKLSDDELLMMFADAPPERQEAIGKIMASRGIHF
jgi:predicted DNA-binding protein